MDIIKEINAAKKAAGNIGSTVTVELNYGIYSNNEVSSMSLSNKVKNVGLNAIASFSPRHNAYCKKEKIVNEKQTDSYFHTALEYMLDRKISFKVTNEFYVTDGKTQWMIVQLKSPEFVLLVIAAQKKVKELLTGSKQKIEERKVYTKVRRRISIPKENLMFKKSN